MLLKVNLVHRPKVHRGTDIQRGEFFVHRLGDGVTGGKVRARFAHPEAQLTEQTLALTDPEVNGEALFEERREGLAIPEVTGESDVLRTSSKCRLHGLQLSFREPVGASGVNSFGETRQALLVELADPVLNAPGGISEKATHLGGRHPLSHEEESVETIVVSGLVGAADLILQGEDHTLGVRYGQRSHDGLRPTSWIRNYL